jgi:hypothetical protein
LTAGLRATSAESSSSAMRAAAAIAPEDWRRRAPD